MNVLELSISEVSFKIDNEDMKVLLTSLNSWGENFQASTVEDKMKIYSLRKVHQKLEMRIIQTKGTTKEYTFRVEPVQAFAMMNILIAVLTTLHANSYEANVCRRYRDVFHQKLQAL